MSSQGFEEIFHRIQIATKTKTQSELANVLHIKQSSVSDAKRRKSIPNPWFLKLFDSFGLNPDWIKEGTDPMYLRTDEGAYTAAQSAVVEGLAEDAWHYGDSSAKSVLLTVHGMSCEYKEGGLSPLLSQVGKISLPFAFAEPCITVVRVDATNMEPSIMRGAYIGVDITTKMPISGSVFAMFSPHEGLILRRPFLNSDAETYILRSDKEGYPETIMNADVLNTRIMGRVNWVFQNI